MTRRDIIKFRRGTAAEWTASEPQPGGEILRLGEPGYEKDTGKLKIGDGVTPWNSLPYLQAENNQDVILQPEDVQDVIGADGFLIAGTGINITYDDDNNNLTIDAVGWQKVISGMTAENGGKYYAEPLPFLPTAPLIINDPVSANTGDFYIVKKYPSSADISVGGVVYQSNEGVILYRIYTTTQVFLPPTWTTYTLDDFHSVVANNITGEFDKISFNITADPTIETAEIGWDAAEGTLDLGLEGGTKIHIGEHSYFRIRNNTGSVLRAGQAVYASDVHNNSLIEASLYAADGSIREIRFIGLVLTDIDINQKGYAINFGHVENLDTRGNGAVNGAQNLYAVDEPAWVEGDILYVHPTIPGKLTKVEPKHSISAAIVLYVHQNNGRIFVRPTSYGHLDDNHDVDLTGLEDNNLLAYNSVAESWEPSTNFTYNEDTGQTTISTEGKNNSVRLIQVSDTGSPRLNIIHNRGIVDTQTPLQSGDVIGSIFFTTINSSDANSISAQISAYTATGLSSYTDTPAVLRFANRNKEGGINNLYIIEDGTIQAQNGAVIGDNAKNTSFGPDRGTGVQIFNTAYLSDGESSGGSLSWSLGIIEEGETSATTVVGSTSAAYVVVPSGQINSGIVYGHTISALRNVLPDNVDDGRIGSIAGQWMDYGHSVYGDATTTQTDFGIGVSIAPWAGVGNITTAYDIWLRNTTFDAVIDASGTIKSGTGSITSRYGIVQESADPNIFNGSVQINGGLSAPTKIENLGAVSGNVSINYGRARQIQTLTLNGTATNFIEGSSWPSSDSVDVLLEITVSSTTSVTWSIVDDWYNPVPSFVPGKYLVLLRSIGTTIQGHYIGEKTN